MEDEKKNSFLIISVVIIGYLSYLSSPSLHIVALLLLFVSLVVDFKFSIAISIMSHIIGVNFYNTELFIEMAVLSIVAIMAISKNKIQIDRLIGVSSFLALSTFITCVFTLNSEIITWLLFLYNIIIFLYIGISTDNTETIKNAIKISGLAIALMSLIRLYQGDFSVLSEGQQRLSYNDNIKRLACPVAFSIFFALSELINYKLISKNKLVFNILILVICFATIILTYARGAILALVVSSFLLLWSNLKSNFRRSIFIYAIIFFILGYVLSNIEFDSTNMFENIEGGNGRFDIWRNYFNYIIEHGVFTVIFGLGTGDLSYINGFYQHSVILSYFFNFGLNGFLFLIYSNFFILKRSIKNKDDFTTALFILVNIVFFSHGTYNEPLYFYALGLSLSYSLKQKII